MSTPGTSSAAGSQVQAVGDSVKDGGAIRQLGGPEASRRGRASAPRRQPLYWHGLGRQSPWLKLRRGRRQSPSAVALFLSKKGKHGRGDAAGLPRVRRVSNATSSSRCNSLGSVALTLEELRQITNNFSDDPDQLLGEGAFGKVYKGVLPNGDTIAVKRFASTIAGLQDVQYENEAQHLMRLKHPNIVQLVGYCSETEMKLVRHNGTFVRAEKPERLLCLEYMPKGSLREHLSDETSGLEWNTRYKIIEGICYGLQYLHEEWQATPIIHMDLKPANILLDDRMVPKIADFGLSRLFGEDQTRTCTRSCKGTPGYMAPEYLEKGVITKMFDIFSLGVVIIEIITGIKDYPTDETETTSQQYIDRLLNNWRHRLTKAQGYTSQNIDYEQIKKCIQIGLLCVKFDRVKRPTINQIIKMLETVDEAYQKEREQVENADGLSWIPSSDAVYSSDYGILDDLSAFQCAEDKSLPSVDPSSAFCDNQFNDTYLFNEQKNVNAINAYGEQIYQEDMMELLPTDQICSGHENIDMLQVGNQYSSENATQGIEDKEFSIASTSQLTSSQNLLNQRHHLDSSSPSNITSESYADEKFGPSSGSFAVRNSKVQKKTVNMQPRQPTNDNVMNRHPQTLTRAASYPCENYETERRGLGKRTLGDPQVTMGTSVVVDGSFLSSMSSDNSVEEISVRQLQDAISQLDLQTTLCIRDGLYRLARSAQHRHLMNNNGDSQEVKDLQNAETSCKFVDPRSIKTQTNAIDRSTALLLYHQSSDHAAVMPHH